MWSNPQEISDLVTFTEGILDGKLHYLCSICRKKHKPKILVYLVEIFCLTRQELGRSHMCWTISGSVPNVASMAMFKKGDELKKKTI